MKRVMIVDADKDVRASIDKALCRGYEIIAVPTAKDAVEVFKPGQYDCLVVDYNLGKGSDGIDLVRDIRHRDERVGVVMVTGNMDVTEVLVQGLGVWSCIEKPVDANVLREKVGEACELSGMEPSTLHSIESVMVRQAERARGLREDLRAETKILPPGSLM